LDIIAKRADLDLNKIVGNW